MGPVRHRLINLLSIVVVVQLAVALVALAARGGLDLDGKKSETPVAAGAAPTRTENGVLAAGNFTKRRGSKGTSGTTQAPVVSTTPPTGPASTATPSTSPAPTTTTTGAAPTTTTTGAPVRNAPVNGAPASAAAAHPSTTSQVAADDPTGDTVADGSGKSIAEGRADIVRTGAAYGPAGVTFSMQVARPTDPHTDERWTSDTTYATWSVDTTGDGTADFEIQYFAVDEDNLGGSVSKPGDGGDTVCDVTAATYSADGYKLTVDPQCLGNPTSFSYKAALLYDTNPADENADVASDTAPNGGWSFPVRNSG